MPMAEEERDDMSVEDEKGREEAIDDDEMSPGEGGFLKGYEDSDKEEKEKAKGDEEEEDEEKEKEEEE